MPPGSKAVPPAGVSYEEVNKPVYRDLLIMSSLLERDKTQGPGITLRVRAEGLNNSGSSARPVCYLAFGSQVRLLEAARTLVVGPNQEFTIEGTVYFPRPLDANESDLIYCRPLRPNEVVP